MARKPSAPSLRQPGLSADEIRTGILRLQRRIAELEAFDPNTVSERRAPEVKALQVSIEGTLERIFGSDTPDFNRLRPAARLDSGPISMGRQATIAQVRGYLEDGKRKATLLLQQAIRGLEEELEHHTTSTEAPHASSSLRKDPRRAFVVHGRDEASKHEVARFLDRIGLEPIILHERPNKGRTIITKFQEEAHDVSFAIVIMTPDDEGGLAGGPSSPRARQNVIFELGFFYGKLGSGHVVALVKDKIETPSDFDGVVYIPLDAGGAWKMLLAREMKAAGLDFSAEAVFDF